MKVFLFTGLSASGKSTIAKTVSQMLDIPRVDLHSIMRIKAQEAGFMRTRDWVLSKGVDQILEQVKTLTEEQIIQLRNDRGLIVDEVLDLNTLNYLVARFREDEFRIVYIRTNRHDRNRFMAKRLGEGRSKKEVLAETRFLDKLKERVGIRDIIERADFRFQNYGRLDDIVSSITETLKEELRVEITIRRERGL